MSYGNAGDSTSEGQRFENEELFAGILFILKGT